MYQKTILDNGVRIVTEKVPAALTESIGIWVDVGSRDETPRNNGSSHFLEHMLFKGTTNRSARQIAIDFDMLGGMSNAFTSTEATCFYSSILDAHLPRLVDQLSDLFCHSVFDEAELERERQVILQEISMVEDTPDDQIHDFFGTLLWGEHPLGNTVLGSRQVVANITRTELVDYFHHFYVPQNLIIAGVGNLEHERFVELWHQAFAGWDRGLTASSSRLRPLPIEPQRQVYTKELEQVHMVLGSYGLSAVDERRYALHLLNVLLGGNMSSRLFQEIREKRGLSYSVYSSITPFADAGQFSIYLGLDKESVNEALEIIYREIERLKIEEVTAAELDNVKEYARAGLYLSMENLEARMTQLARNELHFERYFAMDELLAGIDQVNSNDLTELSRELFAKPLAAAVLGPIEVEEIDWPQEA